MNCNEYKDKLFAYVEGLLDDSDKEAIAAHLKVCSVCRDEVSKTERLRERLVADGATYAESDLENAVFDRIVREQTFKLRKVETANYKIGIWRNIMNTKVTKFAAAAVIIIGVILGYQIFTGTSSVSWAEVAERVAKVKAFVYHIHMSMGELPEGKVIKLEVEAKISEEYGMTMNSYMDGKLTSRMFAQVEEQAMITLIPDQKKYMRVLFTDEMFEKMRQENRDPTKIVDGFLTGEYTELGRREINGITVEGVESCDSDLAQGMLGNAVGRLWVDVETGWPVRITIDILHDNGMQMEMVIEDFEWDVEVDASEFAAEIPEDYELMAELDLDIGQLETGEQIVGGLRFFAEGAEGRYPSKLTVMTISREVAEMIGSRIASGAAKEPSQEDMQSIMELQMAGAFFGRLANEDKDPVYYGDTVTAADVDKVLLRWKLDDGQYRVIYGDLRIEDVSAERLAELEAD